MPNNEFDIIQLFIILIFSVFIIFRILRITINSKELERIICDKLETDLIKVKSIDKLNFKERLRYGDPPFNILRVYIYYVGVFTGLLSYSRKVVLEKSIEEPEVKYISIQIKGKKLYQLKEFDSYDI